MENEIDYCDICEAEITSTEYDSNDGICNICRSNENYFEEITHNRKLKLEEYDDEGNLIDCVEFSKEDLFDFYGYKNNAFNNILTSRKDVRDYLGSGNVELKYKLLSDVFMRSEPNQDLINSIEYILKTYTEEEINFALKIKDHAYNEFTVFLSMKDYNRLKGKDFFELLKWIRSTDGIYYAVANDGCKGMAYLEKPTKKQAKYQRLRNGKRIVFLSFKDWKEYNIPESELE